VILHKFNGRGQYGTNIVTCGRDLRPLSCWPASGKAISGVFLYVNHRISISRTSGRRRAHLSCYADLPRADFTKRLGKGTWGGGRTSLYPAAPGDGLAEVILSASSEPSVASLVSADKQKKTPWPLVRKRTIPTERPPPVDEIYCQLLWIEGCRVVSAADPPRSLISVF
jgi:hypothetical protein